MCGQDCTNINSATSPIPAVTYSTALLAWLKGYLDARPESLVVRAVRSRQSDLPRAGQDRLCVRGEDSPRRDSRRCDHRDSRHNPPGKTGLPTDDTLEISNTTSQEVPFSGSLWNTAQNGWRILPQAGTTARARQDTIGAAARPGDQLVVTTRLAGPVAGQSDPTGHPAPKPQGRSCGAGPDHRHVHTS